MNLKLTILVGLFLCSTLTTMAQMGTLVVGQTKRYDIVVEGTEITYDLYVGFSADYQDTIKIIDARRTIDTFLIANIGDSIQFYVNKIQPENNSDSRPITETFLSAADSNYFFVDIRMVCQPYLDIYGSHPYRTRKCLSVSGPLYYLDGKPVFSDDPKENKRLKKEYEKANRKRKKGA